jgi:hypothetical protein
MVDADFLGFGAVVGLKFVWNVRWMVVGAYLGALLGAFSGLPGVFTEALPEPSLVSLDDQPRQSDQVVRSATEDE